MGTDYTKEFKKICMEGSGKGRIELVGSKYIFGYESQIDRKKNVFELALDFPVVGETKTSLSLDPKLAQAQIRRSELASVLREKVEERADKEKIMKAVEDFFVFASDFIAYKAQNVYPKHFSLDTSNDHFVLFRETPSYKFSVDNFSDNKSYFERSVFTIFLKNNSRLDPIMTLFLVPQTCDR